jgi:hypothetical protein
MEKDLSERVVYWVLVRKNLVQFAAVLAWLNRNEPQSRLIEWGV